MTASRKWIVLPEQIASYRENGFLIVEKLFSDAECDELYELFCRHADAQFSALMNPDRTLPEPKDREKVRALMANARIVDILEQLQEATIDGLMTQVLFKRAGSDYAGQAWSIHQDNAYPQAEPGAFLTINLFLEEADRENGCLFIYPGSHRYGLLPFTPRPSFREKPGVSPGNTTLLPAELEGTQRDVFIGKGGMLILHGDVIHGSYPNPSPTRSRPLFQATYINQGVNFIPGRNAKRERIPLR